MLAEKSLLEWATLYYNVNVKYVRHAFTDEGTKYMQTVSAGKEKKITLFNRMWSTRNPYGENDKLKILYIF
jgi:hypothetical protein